VRGARRGRAAGDEVQNVKRVVLQTIYFVAVRQLRDLLDPAVLTSRGNDRHTNDDGERCLSYIATRVLPSWREHQRNPPKCDSVRQNNKTIIQMISNNSKTMFMVLSSWQSHCESSPGSFDECRTMPSGCQPKTKPDDLGCESAYRLPESTPTIAIYYYYSAPKLILILPSHGG